MKQCSKCKQSKSLSEFNKNKWKKDGLQTRCRTCTTKQHRSYYNKNKEKQKKQIYEAGRRRLQEYQQRLCEYLIEHPCVECGKSDIRALEFDHLRDKKKEVTKLLRQGYSWDIIVEEIKKCEVRCSNCHGIKTHKENNSYKHRFTMGL